MLESVPVHLTSREGKGATFRGSSDLRRGHNIGVAKYASVRLLRSSEERLRAEECHRCPSGTSEATETSRKSGLAALSTLEAALPTIKAASLRERGVGDRCGI